MKTFTGWEYLLIDAANCYGLDKLTFEERIAWANAHLHDLEAMEATAESKPLYHKAVMAVRAAQRGEATGHLVAFDAVCSGIQIMSAITGCVDGARATGMVDPDRRADAYTEVSAEMARILKSQNLVAEKAARADVKYAVMTSCYGSTLVPKRLFGEDTPELEAFDKACLSVAPGAFTLLQELLDSWQPYALSHEWKLPDGFYAKIKVMESVQTRIEVDELDHATFTYQYKDNIGTRKGLSNVANVVHSIDAYILRCMVRRCNYNKPRVQWAGRAISEELLERELGYSQQDSHLLVLDPSDKLPHYVERYESTGLADIVILDHLHDETVKGLSSEHLRGLNRIIQQMLTYEPFPLITIHDSFAAHANNVNHVRHWYKEILAELADSEILSDILNQIHGGKGTYRKLTSNLAQHIRQSNYALS